MAYSILTPLLNMVARLVRAFLSHKNAVENHPINKQLAKEETTSAQQSLDVQGFARHVYRNRYIPYFGREQEKLQLRDFLISHGSFKWWLVCGAGGSGKSRLALELCRCALGHEKLQGFTQAWQAGFIDARNISREDWESWAPTQDTLLVFDYAASAMPEKDNVSLADILVMLAEKVQSTGSVRIRVLLLEREYKDTTEVLQPWYANLTRNPGARYTHVGAQEFQRPLELGYNTDDAASCVWQIMKHTFDSQSPPLTSIPQEQEMLDLLRGIDPFMRPLFAVLLAEAVAEGLRQEIPCTQWDKEALVRYVIERTYTNYWQPRGISVADMLALALATVCGGLEIPSKVLLEKINAIAEASGAEQVDLSRLKSVGLVKKNERGVSVITSLQPDIIGELFVLETELSVLGEMSGMQCQILPLAWELAPFETAEFFDRCSKDFLRHPNFYQWFMADIHGLAWCMVGVNSIARYDERDIEKSRAIYEAVGTVESSFAVDEQRAMAAFNLINAYLKANMLEHAQSLYADLCTIPDSPAVDERRAKAAFNLIVYYGNAGDLKQAQQLHADICALPNSPAVDEQCAKAGVNLIVYYGNAGDLEQARQLYVDICALPRSPAVDEQRAKAGVNLIVYYGNAGDLEQARQLYADICALPNSPAVDEQRATAAFNLTVDYGNAGDLEQARQLYADICALPSSPAVDEQRAKAAFNLTVDYGNAGDLEQARQLYADICALPRSPAVDEICARLDALLNSDEPIQEK